MVVSPLRGWGAGNSSCLQSNRRTLLGIHEVSAAVLLPARFRAFRAKWLLLAVTNGANACGGNSLRHQRLLGRVGAVFAQRQVVLDGSALVAVSLNHECHVGMLLQEACIGLHNGLILRGDLIAVVLEEDVLHILREQARVAVASG